MIYNKKGMTLIEVVVAIAIVGIIAVGFLSIFSSGFSFIIRAGNKSTAVFRNHAEIEASLSTFGSNTSSELEFELNDGTLIVVHGEIEVFTQEFGKGNTNITIFRPSN